MVLLSLSDECLGSLKIRAMLRTGVGLVRAEHEHWNCASVV